MAIPLALSRTKVEAYTYLDKRGLYDLNREVE